MSELKEIDIVFHIGLPKSASTFLQKNYFPWLDVLYLGKHYHLNERATRTTEVFEKNFKAISSFSPINLDAAKIEEIRQSIFALAQEFNVQKLVYSNEGLVGSYAENFRNGYLIAHCLKKIFNSPKIILIIRRQDHFLESLYRQAIRNGHSLSVSKFLNYNKGKFYNYRQDYRANIDLKTLQWDQLVNFYQTTFGKENVLVLPLEMLKNESEQFLHKIAKFIGVSSIPPINSDMSNRRDSFLLLLIKKFFNSFVHTNVSNIFIQALQLQKVGNLINKLGIEHDFIIPSLSEKIRNSFKDSNKILSERENLTLEKYGYF